MNSRWSSPDKKDGNSAEEPKIAPLSLDPGRTIACARAIDGKKPTRKLYTAPPQALFGPMGKSRHVTCITMDIDAISFIVPLRMNEDV